MTLFDPDPVATPEAAAGLSTLAGSRPTASHPPGGGEPVKATPQPRDDVPMVTVRLRLTVS